MIPRLETRFAAYARRRQEFLAMLERLPGEARTFRPAPDAWSLGLVAQHLWLVERGVVHVLDRGREKAELPADPLAPLRRLALRVVFSGRFRFRAPLEAIVPGEEMPLDALRAEWDATHARGRAVLDALTPAQAARRTFRHPITGPMNASQSVAFLSQHHDHHLAQVARIRAATGFPRA